MMVNLQEYDILVYIWTGLRDTGDGVGIHAGSYHQAPVIFLGNITEKHSHWRWWNWWKLATGIFSIEFSLKNPDYVDQLNPQQNK